MCIPGIKWKLPKKRKNLGYGPVQAKMAESNEEYSVVILPLTSVSTGEKGAKSEMAHQDLTIFILKYFNGTVHIDSFPRWKKNIYNIERRKKENSCSTTSSCRFTYPVCNGRDNSSSSH